MLQSFSYNGKIIHRREDGLINLTQMCNANGRRIDHWKELKSTKAYIATLQDNCPGSCIICAEEGATGGTWGHPELAKCLAQWIEKLNLISTNTTGIVYIYLDEGNSAYKIGFTTNIKKREQQHKSSNPFLCLVSTYEMCTVDDEALIHEKLLAYRIKGTTEWYRKHPDVIKLVKLLLSNKDG